MNLPRFTYPNLPHVWLLVATSLACAVATAQQPEVPPDTAGEIELGQLLAMLQRQDAELEAQRALMADQQATLEIQTRAIQALQTRVDQLGSRQEQQLSQTEMDIRARLESLEAVAAPAQEETTTVYDATEFPGAVPVPGTRAALKIGGFVKMNVVQSLDSLGSQNRFIVGTIPTDGATEGDSEAALTVQQSRLNLELRENTDFGQLRAFIEGDFAGEGDTLRLRHAFGQFRDWMAGKTWSTFMDVDSSPEELDFEGINGRINVRQPQLRFFPDIGEAWNLAVSIEDPAPDVTGGDGVSQIPDIVASIQRTVRDAWNVKAALLLRTLRARPDVDPTKKEEATGWGVSISGNRTVSWWNPQDKVMFQLNLGKGYGRYINDLSTVGGQDAVFNDDGDLATLPVWSTYVAFQKWWRDSLRSTFILSTVRVDNKSFQPGDAYKRTQRFSGNVIWSPTPRIDVGGELLWGRREDKDGSDGSASQIQASVRYRF